MTTYYHSSSSLDLNEDQHHNQPFIFKPHLSSSSSSSSLFFNPSQKLHEGFHYHDDQSNKSHLQHKAKFDGSQGGSCDVQEVLKNESSVMEFSIVKKEERYEQSESSSSSMKWWKMVRSSKNPMKQPELHSDHNMNSSNTIRVCSDCNTTKTPLWRSGPSGPKSLCNACGIRQRKARRALMAGSATDAAVITKTNKAMKQKNNGKCKSININDCKTSSKDGKLKKNLKKKQQLCFDDLTITLSKSSAFRKQVFAQDEKEGAILLMALSYGMVHG